MNFNEYIDQLHLDDDIKIGNSIVPVSTFKRIFEGVPESPTYEDLMFIDKGEKGYKPFFDELKEKGILN